MSGVSTSTEDLSALIQGGDDFIKRLAQLRDAKAAMDASLLALNLGKDIAQAQRDAQIALDQANKAIESAKDEGEKIIAAAKQQANEIIGQALVDADKARTEAYAAKAALEADILTGRKALNDWSAKVSDDAKAIMDQATKAQAAVDKAALDNATKAAELDKLQTELNNQLAAAKAAEDAFNAKLSAMKAAVA